MVAESRRRTALQEKFGPEYDRTVGSADSRRTAERDLAERERAHESLDIRPLSEASRTVSRTTGSGPSSGSSTTPSSPHARRTGSSATSSSQRGYPDDDFDQQAAAVSVDHPHVVERYRHGHQMVHGNGASGDERTEDLRKAMVDFRAVFEEDESAE